MGCVVHLFFGLLEILDHVRPGRSRALFHPLAYVFRLLDGPFALFVNTPTCPGKSVFELYTGCFKVLARLRDLISFPGFGSLLLLLPVGLQAINAPALKGHSSIVMAPDR
jgi:hypothetical protein